MDNFQNMLLKIYILWGHSIPQATNNILVIEWPEDTVGKQHLKIKKYCSWEICLLNLMNPWYIKCSWYVVCPLRYIY